MAIKFEKIKPGMRLADIHKYGVGNTTVRAEGLWWVDVISVDAEKRTAVVRWNGNREETYSERELTRLCVKDSVKVKRHEAGDYEGSWLVRGRR